MVFVFGELPMFLRASAHCLLSTVDLVQGKKNFLGVILTNSYKHLHLTKYWRKSNIIRLITSVRGKYMGVPPQNVSNPNTFVDSLAGWLWTLKIQSKESSGP